MSTRILTAIRSVSQLKGNIKFTALEIAHRMNSSGYGRVSYTFMGYKTGYSKRTSIEHMKRLVAMGIFSKTVYRLKFGNAINLYKCLLPLPQLSRPSANNSKGEDSAQILPTHKTEEEKFGSIRDKIKNQQWALRNLSLSEDARKRCLEEIAMLEGFLLKESS